MYTQKNTTHLVIS